jgi:hypothetical protein
LSQRARYSIAPPSRANAIGSWGLVPPSGADANARTPSTNLQTSTFWSAWIATRPPVSSASPSITLARFNTRCSAPVCASQARTVPSAAPVTSRVPSGANAIAVIGPR